MNPLKSNTVLGMLLAVVSWLLSPEVIGTIHNQAVANVLTGIGAVWFAWGVRRAIAKAAIGLPK